MYARLLTLQLGIIGTAATLLLGSALLLRGAGASPGGKPGNLSAKCIRQT